MNAILSVRRGKTDRRARRGRKKGVEGKKPRKEFPQKVRGEGISLYLFLTEVLWSFSGRDLKLRKEEREKSEEKGIITAL